MMVLGVALVMYVKMRSFLAVDQLVRIYREVSRDMFLCNLHFRVLLCAQRMLDCLDAGNLICNIRVTCDEI